MTKTEKEQLERVWAGLENLLTITDPHLDMALKGKNKLKESGNMIDLLRIQLKYMKFNEEACEREKDSLFKMLNEQGGQL